MRAEAEEALRVYREEDTMTEDTQPASWEPEVISREMPAQNIKQTSLLLHMLQ